MSKEGERQDNFFNVCSECKGKCCKDARPPITLTRKKIIEKYLEQQGISIGNPFIQKAYMFPREDNEGFCIFLDKETIKCKIHPVKPETCVAGPITFDINLITQKIEWYLKMESICPLAGKLYKNKEQFQKHLKSAKREILNLIRELEPKALEAILRIEEPETFKITEDKIGKLLSHNNLRAYEI
ncbi:MAG: YkgJ family cysteine cluster protein [Candidatus Bathycorpusculaceae bacterium]